MYLELSHQDTSIDTLKANMKRKREKNPCDRNSVNAFQFNVAGGLKLRYNYRDGGTCTCVCIRVCEGTYVYSYAYVYVHMSVVELEAV